MKKWSMLLCILLCSSGLFGQTGLHWTESPISGFTAAPKAWHAHVNLSFTAASINAEYNSDGDKITFKDANDGYVDPVFFHRQLILSGRFGFSPSYGISLELPLVVYNRVKMNPISGITIGDLSGDTGMGDASIGAYYLKNFTSPIRILAAAGVKLATGSTPYDPDRTSGAPTTGTGYSSYYMGIEADAQLLSKVIFSVAAGYILNNEITRDDIDAKFKVGNIFILQSMLTYQIINNFAFGIQGGITTSGENSYDGEKAEDSDSKLIALAPVIGYQINSGKLRMNINVTYQFPISGKNRLCESGFVITSTLFL